MRFGRSVPYLARRRYTNLESEASLDCAQTSDLPDLRPAQLNDVSRRGKHPTDPVELGVSHVSNFTRSMRQAIPQTAQLCLDRGLDPGPSGNVYARQVVDDEHRQPMHGGPRDERRQRERSFFR